MKSLILLTHVGATLAMFGLIWFVQIVHYPLFDRVGRDAFTIYEAAHTSLTTLVVAPLMGLELLTGLLLLAYPPERIPFNVLLVGIILIGLIWASTAFVQVPQHAILSQGYDSAAHSLLVKSNWVRTILWSLRALLVLWILAKCIDY